MTSRHLHEMIDACRPGHEDINQPELSELAGALKRDPSLPPLFERSQELDEAIRTTFQAVTPPPGLAERLLASIETPASEAPVIADAASPAVAEPESGVELARHTSRRSLGIWAGVASLVAIVAVITLWFQWPQPISLTSERDIAENVDRWNADLDAKNSWQATADVPSRVFPTWQHLDLRSVARWQWVTKKRRIACYDFAITNGRVRLFVAQPTASVALPTVPPAGYPSPNGWHVGAWQANGRVYYLAVRAEGDSKGLYSRVIASPFNPA